MANLRLEKLQLHNWMMFRDVEINFPKSGLVLVTGDSGKKLDSVGAGKTSIGEAICTAIAGIQGRFSRLGDYSTHGKGNMLIRMTGTLQDKPLVIDHGYKHPLIGKTGEGLKFRWADQELEYPHIRQTREKLNEMLGVTPAVAQWTIFIDGDNIRFNRMPEADRVELLMAIRAQPRWT